MFTTSTADEIYQMEQDYPPGTYVSHKKTHMVYIVTGHRLSKYETDKVVTTLRSLDGSQRAPLVLISKAFRVRWSKLEPED